VAEDRESQRMCARPHCQLYDDVVASSCRGGPAARRAGGRDPRFANVIRIFAALFPGRRVGGGALAVYIAGKPVVDIWTGWSDRSGEVAWAANTGAMVFSAMKGVAATVVHRLVDPRAAVL
jgi:CubicO group peptidase (beta-lactamase class C family)